MPVQTLAPSFHDLLRGRYIATLATENADGSARPLASLMVDARKPGTERGVTAAGRVELISGHESQEINRRLHSRYLSATAMSDPHVGPVFASFDDVTIRLTPVSWITWDMAMLDTQAFGGRLGKTPGYMLPLD